MGVAAPNRFASVPLAKLGVTRGIDPALDQSQIASPKAGKVDRVQFTAVTLKNETTSMPNKLCL